MKEREKRSMRSTGTRDAVETAIDLSKRNQRSTWEALTAKNRGRISQWSVDEKPVSPPESSDQLSDEC